MRGFAIFAGLALLAAGPAAAQEADETPVAMETGLASYFGREIAGNRTASGERCDPDDFTAAHRTIPFGGRVRVTNLLSGLSTIVRINDRGPFRGNRVIDLSHAAARAIGLDRAGIGRVSLTVLRD